jgi:hypothetical protein
MQKLSKKEVTLMSQQAVTKFIIQQKECLRTRPTSCCMAQKQDIKFTNHKAQNIQD